MAEQLTPQQRQAVYHRGGKLLVSAAAGSGKTKVLVDRLMSYLLDPQDPADIDEFLIITYTRAAASELRAKIAAKLTERMAQEPENRHLQRQMQRLYLTKISTVHGFCSDILREYAYRLDIPADFRMAEEQECQELRQNAMDRVLEQVYDSEDGDFRAFLDTQSLGRDDRMVPQITMQVYDAARCHLNPDKWLEQCLENAQPGACTDAGQTPWGRYLMEDLFSYLDLQIQAMEAAWRAAAGMEKPAALLADTLAQLRLLRASRTWDDILERKNIQYGTLSFPRKNADPETVQRIKAVREGCKDGLNKKLAPFADSSAVLLEDLRQSAAAVRGIVALVRQFGDEYQRRKRLRRVLDFGDLEHRALDLLTGPKRDRITAAAEEIGSRFREVLVDEYQDSNAVQDALFAALTNRRQNCFMVGDVKQSIYQFRLADPSIFIEKYNSYSTEPEAGKGRKVLLSSNFRSCAAVLEGVNDIFRLTMSPAVGGLYYGDEEALHEGVPHEPLGEPEVELLMMPVQDATYTEEAALVAQRITELLDGRHMVRSGEGLRPIQAEDIAILLRTPGSTGACFREALERRGIPCSIGSGEDLLQQEEVTVLWSLLQAVYNPRRDIPLVAALTSPIFGFTADDLAALRQENRRDCVYDALLASPAPKARAFLQVLEPLRRMARRESPTKLIEYLLLDTRLDSYYAAGENGQACAANLQSFYELALSFEAGGGWELGRFLDYLEDLEAQDGRGLEASTPDHGGVTLMSIHKSKGLEFPVVFVSNLSHQFSREDLKRVVLCDRELGLGLTAVVDRVRYPTLAKRAISAKIMADCVSEELRVLYVALTRARDRLIMTYGMKTPEKTLGKMARRLDMGGAELLAREAGCPGQWVMMAALQRTEAGELFALGDKPACTHVSDYPWRIRVLLAPEAEQQAAQQQEERPGLSGQEQALLQGSLGYRYPHQAATHAPSKQTATQRKGREKDAEAAEQAQESLMPERTWRLPDFAGADQRGAAAGTAVHSFLQYASYAACREPGDAARELERLVQGGFLTDEQARLVDCRRIAAFFRGALGQKLLRSKQVLREFKFSILEDGGDSDPALAGEQILLQGVVDCAIVEPEGITVIDFKTDYVTEETLPQRAEHYRPQVLAYAKALERIYETKVRSAVLYFFRLDRAVPILGD